jgi:hypothetical protein
MRLSLKQTGSTIIGWDKKQTSRPTSFMMTTYFPSVLVLLTPKARMFGRPVNGQVKRDQVRPSKRGPPG